MVKSNVCPKCLGDLPCPYIEEGHVIISEEELICPNCGFRVKGSLNEHREKDFLLEKEDHGRL